MADRFPELSDQLFASAEITDLLFTDNHNKYVEYAHKDLLSNLLRQKEINGNLLRVYLSVAKQFAFY